MEATERAGAGRDEAGGAGVDGGGLSGGAAAYSGSYYDDMVDGSLGSARAVMPWLLSATGAKSVLDVGCGTGAWLRGALESGAERVFGVDGSYVRREELVIDPACFEAVDLESVEGAWGVVERAVSESGGFDLVVSVEVGEHLPDGVCAAYVELLCSVSPVVFFSAAIPGQGGTHHINERWPGYWAEKFDGFGYGFVDELRPAFWHDEQVAWWYRQNMLLFVRRDGAGVPEELLQRVSEPGARPMSLVHPVHYVRLADSVARSKARPRGVSWVVAALKGGYERPEPLEKP